MIEPKARPAAVPGATLAFVEYRRNGNRYLEFDASGTGCPVPMINAMAGLAQIVESQDRLVMLNGFEPQGLYDKLSGCFTWQVEVNPRGGVRIEFQAIPGRSRNVDFSDNRCQG